MWLFNRKKVVKPKKAASFHEKRLRFTDREDEDNEQPSSGENKKEISWGEDEED